MASLIIDLLLGSLLDVAIHKLSKKSLASKVIRDAEKWVKKLPHEFRDLDPRSLLTNDRISQPYTEALRHTIEEFKFPSRIDWENALKQNWEYKKSAYKEGDHPFFLADYHDVQPWLKDLSEDIYAVCMNDPDLFRAAILSHLSLRETNSGLDSIEFDTDPQLRVSLSELPTTGEHFVGRYEELELITNAWANRTINLVTILAPGGTGKSALTKKWLAQMASNKFDSAWRVFAYSFYNQGISGQLVSVDDFFDKAFRFFGNEDIKLRKRDDKGVLLAGIVNYKPSLIIIDGLEILQHPFGSNEGKLKRIAKPIGDFLRELAALNKGLCLVTSRIRVHDISEFVEETVQRIDLGHLSPQDGAKMLRSLGVKGDQQKLEQASLEFKGHCLALSLLGSYLRDVLDGDINKFTTINFMEEDREQEGKAKKMMRVYESWFGDGLEMAIMNLLGLFDRPASEEEVEMLLNSPILEKHAEKLTNRSLSKALSLLRRAQLLYEAEENRTLNLDSHPLIREYFASRFEKQDPNTWKKAHARLFQFLESTSQSHPTDLEGMKPLFHAINHGCYAGLYNEALTQIFVPRILHGRERYSVNQLGAFGANLAVLEKFYTKRWIEPVKELNTVNRGIVLHHSGYALRGIGNLEAAIHPMRQALDISKTLKNWYDTSVRSRILGQLYFLKGDLNKGAHYSRIGYENTKNIKEPGDKIEEMLEVGPRLAGILHYLGEFNQADKLFIESEKLIKSQNGSSSELIKYESFLYCLFLIDKGRFDEARNRAKLNLSILDRNIHKAFFTLILGLSDIYESKNNIKSAIEFVEESVSRFINSGERQHLPRGLLARAQVRREIGKFNTAKKDIDESLRIAEGGTMLLFKAEALLELSRLNSAMDELEAAIELGHKSLRLSLDMNYRKLLPEIYMELASLCEQRNDRKGACEWIERAGGTMNEMGFKRLEANYSVLRGEITYC